MEITVKNATCQITEGVCLEKISLTIRPGEIWAVTGPNGSGKTALGKLLAGQLSPREGEVRGLPDQTGYLSFESHLEAIEREIREDDTDYMDRIDPGRTALAFISEKTKDEKKAAFYGKYLGIEPLFHRGLKFLSTGEIRKTLICRALTTEPELLILDDPFSGLDRAAAASLKELVPTLPENGTTPLFILGRCAMMPECVTHVIRMENRRLAFAGTREAFFKREGRATLSAGENRPLPETCFPASGHGRFFKKGDVLVEMNNISVDYQGAPVLDGVNLKVVSGESWMITGPNGSGKSTLLSLINGDSPKAYINDITLFGKKRGTGESIWEIKQHIGFVSAELQINYRASATPLTVILSGLTDSIGVYQKFSQAEIRAAETWLALLELTPKRNLPFRSLSAGEQRMVLIARAMIKQPPLLILDEPCQGLSDENSRFVMDLADRVGKSGKTTLLYVTHQEQDRLASVARHLMLVPKTGGSVGIVSHPNLKILGFLLLGGQLRRPLSRIA